MAIRTDDLLKTTENRPRRSEFLTIAGGKQEDYEQVEEMERPSDAHQVIERLVNRYVERAMLRTELKQYEDGTWFAEIAAIRDVWGHGPTEADALEDLEGTLRDWLDAKRLKRDGTIPVLDLINLNVA